jgi:hypothetical protein
MNVKLGTKEQSAQADKRTFKKYYVPIYAPRGWYQMDLMDMSQVSAKKGNQNMKFVLVIIEIYSRYGFAYPLKNKEPVTVLEGLKKWKEDVGQRDIKGVWSDDGSEWKGVVGKWLKDEGIAHKVVDKWGKNSMGIVERWIRTLRMRIRQVWIENDNLIWLPFLEQVVREYNTTVHSRMNANPTLVWEGESEPRFKRKIVDNYIPAGTKVRLLLLKKTFDKLSALPNWSKEIYTVGERVGNRFELKETEKTYPRWALKVVRKYVLENEGENRLQPVEKQIREVRRENRVERDLKADDIKAENVRVNKVRLPKGQYEVERIVASKKVKGKRLYRVRWKGYDESEDSWLPAKDIADDWLKEFNDKKRKRRKG